MPRRINDRVEAEWATAETMGELLRPHWPEDSHKTEIKLKFKD